MAALSAHQRSAAHPDRRVRPQRPAPGHAARGGRLRARRPVERRLPPRRARRAHRRDRRLLRRLRAAVRARQGARPAASSTTARSARSATARTVCRSTSTGCPAWRLVVASQNHDQIGNRARGDRVTEALDDDQLACAALLTLASPFTPMLFQGEEWAASTPFAFFTSHPEPELGAATAEGRLEEFERMGWDPAVVPDPQDPSTYERSKLDWDELGTGRHAVLLDVYRRLAALRRELPELTDPDLRQVDVAGRRGGAHAGDAARSGERGGQRRHRARPTVELSGEHEVLFTTPAGATLVARRHRRCRRTRERWCGARADGRQASRKPECGRRIAWDREPRRGQDDQPRLGARTRPPSDPRGTGGATRPRARRCPRSPTTSGTSAATRCAPSRCCAVTTCSSSSPWPPTTPTPHASTTGSARRCRRCIPRSTRASRSGRSRSSASRT